MKERRNSNGGKTMARQSAEKIGSKVGKIQGKTEGGEEEQQGRQDHPGRRVKGQAESGEQTSLEEKGGKRSNSIGKDTERTKIGERQSGNASEGRSGEKERKSNMKWRWRDGCQGVAMGKAKEWERKREIVGVSRHYQAAEQSNGKVPRSVFLRR